MRLTIDNNDGLASTRHPFADDLARAQDIVDLFLHFVKENDVGSDLVDEIELPVPRRLLERAFTIVIAAERRPDVRTLLMKAGLSLAQYRPGLGPRLRLWRCLPDGRPGLNQSRSHSRMLDRMLFAVADERLQLADHYRQAIVRSYH